MAKNKIELSGAALRTLVAHLDVLSATEGDVERIEIDDTVPGLADLYSHKATVDFSSGTTTALCHRRTCPWVECDP